MEGGVWLSIKNLLRIGERKPVYFFYSFIGASEKTEPAKNDPLLNTGIIAQEGGGGWGQKCRAIHKLMSCLFHYKMPPILGPGTRVRE